MNQPRRVRRDRQDRQGSGIIVRGNARSNERRNANENAIKLNRPLPRRRITEAARRLALNRPTRPSQVIDRPRTGLARPSGRSRHANDRPAGVAKRPNDPSRPRRTNTAPRTRKRAATRPNDAQSQRRRAAPVGIITAAALIINTPKVTLKSRHGKAGTKSQAAIHPAQWYLPLRVRSNQETTTKRSEKPPWK